MKNASEGVSEREDSSTKGNRPSLREELKSEGHIAEGSAQMLTQTTF